MEATDNLTVRRFVTQNDGEVYFPKKINDRHRNFIYKISY